MNLDKNISQLCLPKHLAVIMDGNGRWAKQRGLTRVEGHKEGTNRAKELIENCLSLQIPHVTLYTFSQENWKRPKEEVHFLFDLLTSFIQREFSKLNDKGVQLRVLGKLDQLPFPARVALQHAIKGSSKNTKLILNLALNYSGRQEIVDACKKLLKQRVKAEDLSIEKFACALYSADQPDPDLLIRTSGELRLSNFLPFQTAYSELYFTKTLWPDFDQAELLVALKDFSTRQRRFGGLDATKPE